MNRPEVMNTGIGRGNGWCVGRQWRGGGVGSATEEGRGSVEEVSVRGSKQASGIGTAGCTRRQTPVARIICTLETNYRDQNVISENLRHLGRYFFLVHVCWK